MSRSSSSYVYHHEHDPATWRTNERNADRRRSRPELPRQAIKVNDSVRKTYSPRTHTTSHLILRQWDAVLEVGLVCLCCLTTDRKVSSTVFYLKALGWDCHLSFLWKSYRTGRIAASQATCPLRLRGERLPLPFVRRRGQGQGGFGWVVCYHVIGE